MQRRTTKYISYLEKRNEINRRRNLEENIKSILANKKKALIHEKLGHNIKLIQVNKLAKKNGIDSLVALVKMYIEL